MAVQQTAAGSTGLALNLALQGGGAHGAYSWGVLDCLLEDGRYGFDGISGTSAGAMNALVLADGLMKGGPQWARLALEEFWQAIADSVPLDLSMPVQGGEGLALMPATRMMLNWTQYLSPYQLNPLNFNPLRQLLKERVDFEGLRRHSPVRLFLAATNANTGKLRLFRNAELSVEAALASACLPMIHHAVEIDGEPYWDGGYSANPAVFPLFYECDSPEILLVLRRRPPTARCRPRWRKSAPGPWNWPSTPACCGKCCSSPTSSTSPSAWAWRRGGWKNASCRPISISSRRPTCCTSSAPKPRWRPTGPSC